MQGSQREGSFKSAAWDHAPALIIRAGKTKTSKKPNICIYLHEGWKAQGPACRGHSFWFGSTSSIHSHCSSEMLRLCSGSLRVNLITELCGDQVTERSEGAL